MPVVRETQPTLTEFYITQPTLTEFFMGVLLDLSFCYLLAAIFIKLNISI